MLRRHRLRLACHVTLLATGAATLAGCASHPGPDRLEAMSPGWTTRANGVSVAQSPTVTIAAYQDSLGERCVFGGAITNLTTDPVRVSIRPAGISVPDDTMVGVNASWGALRRAPILRGDRLVVPTRDSAGGEESNLVRFSLRPTDNAEGDLSTPRPYSAEDVVTHTISASGIESSTPVRPPRTGDVAHYTIVITGPVGEESWDWHFRTVPGPEIVDVHWYQWLALPLLPLYLILNWCGAVD